MARSPRSRLRPSPEQRPEALAPLALPCRHCSAILVLTPTALPRRGVVQGPAVPAAGANRPRRTSSRFPRAGRRRRQVPRPRAQGPGDRDPYRCVCKSSLGTSSSRSNLRTDPLSLVVAAGYFSDKSSPTTTGRRTLAVDVRLKGVWRPVKVDHLLSHAFFLPGGDLQLRDVVHCPVEEPRRASPSLTSSHSSSRRFCGSHSTSADPSRAQPTHCPPPPRPSTPGPSSRASTTRPTASSARPSCSSGTKNGTCTRPARRTRPSSSGSRSGSTTSTRPRRGGRSGGT